ncbi:MAG: alkaline phosphatase family protein [Blastocatellia bacterium]|nr:alkaline phosphatase family protein [Blastocatellia bacterium]
MRRSLLKLLLLYLSFSLMLPFAGAQQRKASKTANISKPKLIVLIVIDQFRDDYLSRFDNLFGQRGFKRLLTKGAYFSNANYTYAGTKTAAGHATIVSGSIPAIHGIIANKWYDREVGAVKESVADPKLDSSSPWKLLTSTIGDQLRMSNNYQSKVVSISMKDRSAVLMAGRNGSGAYWFDLQKGGFISGSYYQKDSPNWVDNFNNRRIPDSFFQKKWEKILSEDAYSIADRDDAPYEEGWQSSAFPHTIAGNGKLDRNFYEHFRSSPFANGYLEEFAEAAISAERLGKGNYTDMFAISFSSTDYIGHRFGPYSHEVQDTMVRMDATVERFLDFLDKHIGLDKTLVAFTSDHGICPVPAYSELHSLGGHRIGGDKLKERIERLLDERFGDANYLLSLVNHQVYLDEKVLEQKRLNISEVEEIVGKEAVKVAGIANYYTRSRLLSGNIASTDTLGNQVFKSFHPKRSGNVYLIVEPFSLIAEFEDETRGTDHGTPYHYDTHVPIIFMGASIKAGVYRGVCSPSDIAPTIASILSIEAPNGSVGRILSEALK